MPVTVTEAWEVAHTEQQGQAIAEFFAEFGDTIINTEFSEFDGSVRTFIDEESAKRYVDFIKTFDPPPYKLEVK